MLITILATAVVLGVLIFVHELGHFVTAKLVDIEVPRFSIGFGPRVAGFRRGETEYVLSLLPLGGYVKMAGMEELEGIEGPAEPRAEGTAEPAVRVPGPRDFEAKSLPARTLVISAGVIMNVIFAFVAYSVVALGWGIPATPDTRVGGVTEERLPEGADALAKVPAGARITAVGSEAVNNWRDLQIALSTARSGPTAIHFAHLPPVPITIPSVDSARANLIFALEPEIPYPAVIDSVVAGEPAARAGLLAGDTVVSAGAAPVGTWQQFVAVIEHNPGQPVPLVVQRRGGQVQLTVTPADSVLDGSGIHYGRIGVTIPYASALAVLPRTRTGPLGAARHGALETWHTLTLTINFLVELVTGRQSPRNLGGPILISQLSGQVVRLGLDRFLAFMAMLSINLAILNLLPIPILDGGNLMFLAFEAVRGRGLSLEQRIRLSQVGFVIILAIMAWAMGNDLLRWFGM